MFKGLELLSKGCKLLSKGLEHMFQALGQKILRGENKNLPLRGKISQGQLCNYITLIL